MADTPNEPENAAAYWPDPTPSMLADPAFNAIWNVIKTWDINVPEVYSGYCGATGNHVRAILDGWNARAALDAQPTTKFGDPAPRSFDKERPGPGWSVSEETHRELVRLEQDRRDAVARGSA